MADIHLLHDVTVAYASTNMLDKNFLAERLRAGDLETVEREARAGMAVPASRSAAATFLAAVLMRKGNVEAAMQAAETALTATPVYTDAYLLRTEVALAQNNHDVALAMCRKIAASPDASRPALVLAAKVLHGQPERIAVLGRLTDGRNGDYKLRMEQAKVARAAGDLGAAAEAVAAALKRKPQSVEALGLRARIHGQQRDGAGLASSVRDLAAIVPEKALGFIPLLIKLKQYKAAVDTLERASADSAETPGLAAATETLNAELAVAARTARNAGDLGLELGALAAQVRIAADPAKIETTLNNVSARCLGQAKEYAAAGQFDLAEELCGALYSARPNALRSTKQAAIVAERREDWSGAFLRWASVANNPEAEAEDRTQAISRATVAAQKAGNYEAVLALTGPIALTGPLAQSGDAQAQARFDKTARHLAQSAMAAMASGDAAGAGSAIRVLATIDSDHARRTVAKWVRVAAKQMSAMMLAGDYASSTELGRAACSA